MSSGMALGRLAAVVALALLAVACAGLGVWQLRRADASRADKAQFAASAATLLHEPPRSLTDDARFKRLEVEGTFLSAPQFLLDNMVEHGQAGYQVLTPFRIAGSSRWLLVNRGWIGVGADRGTLPALDVEENRRRVVGRIDRLPRPALRLKGADDTARGKHISVVQFPTPNELATLANHELFDYQLLLDEDQSNGYERAWRAPGLAPERHLAYAGQWLLLALGAAGASVGLLVRPRRPS